jgi:hypothetical protein
VVDNETISWCLNDHETAWPSISFDKECGVVILVHAAVRIRKAFERAFHFTLGEPELARVSQVAVNSLYGLLMSLPGFGGKNRHSRHG